MAQGPNLANASGPAKPSGTDVADLGPEPPHGADPTGVEADVAPQFDIVRVEPSGEAVVAGRGRPNSRVDLLDAGKVVASTATDQAGNFVIVPEPLKPGSYDLSLQGRAEGQPAGRSKQTIAVSVPPSPRGSVIVALAEPGKPSRLLSGPPGAPPGDQRPPSSGQVAAASQRASSTRTAAPAGTAAVAKAAPALASSGPPVPAQADRDGPAIRSVELENGNGFHASGRNLPGARAEIYLNDSRLASVIAGKDGRWSVTVRKGLTAGHYAVRADAVGANGRVTNRVEVPFDVPARMALPAGDRAEISAATSGNDAVIDSVETALVVPGDNLWDISRTRLGHGRRYTRIYASNFSQIRDPKLIFPGQVLVVPGDD